MHCAVVDDITAEAAFETVASERTVHVFVCAVAARAVSVVPRAWYACAVVDAQRDAAAKLAAYGGTLVRFLHPQLTVRCRLYVELVHGRLAYAT